MAQADDQGMVVTIRGEDGASVLGPDNVPVASQNPGAPLTDSGSLPNLKFPFAAAHNRLLPGGWAREVTVRELPVATTLAGVNMRLKAGAYRELHWHKEAEWAFMLAGSARIAAIDPQGRNFIDDIGRGDLWNFRAGFPHSIQALEDCEFLLVFDDGNFSENETFLVTDWFAHTPRHVLAKNFGVPQSASSNFPSASTIAAAWVELQPGALRELHWHPNNDEWQYWISGHARMTVFGSSGKARTFDYYPGDVGYVPRAMGHYFEAIGDEPVQMLELFRSDHFADLSASHWLALTPAEVVAATLNLDQDTIAVMRKDKPLIMP